MLSWPWEVTNLVCKSTEQFVSVAPIYNSTTSSTAKRTKVALVCCTAPPLLYKSTKKKKLAVFNAKATILVVVYGTPSVP